MAKCCSCDSRKGKRNCPALGKVICSQCCGTKKEKEIACPDDCFYLGTSKKYFAERQESEKVANFERELKSLQGGEDTHLDLLQNIESGIQNVVKEKSDISDRDVEAALEYFIETGKARFDLPSKIFGELPPNVQAIADAVENILGFRESLSGKQEEVITKLKCIWRILDSVRTHFNPKNPHSYLEFAAQFLK